MTSKMEMVMPRSDSCEYKLAINPITSYAMDKLSIVIPAYNAANVIERCLDSILDQDYHIDVEIIVVNDGSTDNTVEILARYEKQYPNIFRIISKENGGQAAARNLGKDMASGDWLWFCDADDYIMKNGLSYVLDNFVDSSIDICTFSSITLDPIALKTFKEPDHPEASVFFEGPSINGYKKKIYHFGCNHIYRLNAIRDIRIHDFTMTEDMLFNLEVYRKNLRLRCTNANIYRYTVSENQLTRKRDPKSMRIAIRGYEHLFKYIKDIREKEGKEDPSLSESLYKVFLGQVQPFISRVLSSDLKISEFRELFERLKQSGIFPIKNPSRRNRLFNFVADHPLLFPLFRFVHRKIILPYMLPKLSRN